MTYNEELNKLSPEERELALKILKEYQEKGKSELFEDLKYQDFEEIPVDIETFLTDDRYLGLAWKDASGKSKLYPYWLGVLKKLFPDNLTTRYHTLLETGSRGLGKSEIACGAVGTYLMYRIMCLKNPLEYYNIKLTEKLVFAFMNITQKKAEEIAMDKFQKTVQMSPWFMSRGKITQHNNQPFWVPPDPIEIRIGSQSSDVLGTPVLFAFFDELSFIKNQDIDKQKEKAKDMVDTAVASMVTRFAIEGKKPYVLCVASSKKSEQSFMETYVKLKADNDPDNSIVVDEPIWKVKPKGTYKEEFFTVAVGNRFLDSEVLPDNYPETLDLYRMKGYSLLSVPIDFETLFKEDINRSLRDYAGISTSSTNKFLSGKLVSQNIDETFKNPFPDIIEVGNAFEDHAQYKDFFNLSNVPKELIHKPLFIHLDMSVSGDMTGIAGVWILGKKPTGEGNDQSKDMLYRLAFSTSVKAPKGHQVSFEKNRNFIRWLKSTGFKIKHISYDTFQSYDTGQQLQAEGFNCSILSVDRVDTDHVCKPYQYFKSVLTERRIIMYKSSRLLDECVDIEKNTDTGKIDHTSGYHKDTLDAVVGATFEASKTAEQYAYECGESLDALLATSSSAPTLEQQHRQIVEAFEDEIKEMLRTPPPTAKPIEQNKTTNQPKQNTQWHEDGFGPDFGMGRAKPVRDLPIKDGILTW